MPYHQIFCIYFYDRPKITQSWALKNCLCSKIIFAGEQTVIKLNETIFKNIVFFRRSWLRKSTWFDLFFKYIILVSVIKNLNYIK